MLSDMISNDVWTKSKTACLYRYNPNGQYFARVRFGGKLHRKKLGTDDYQLARRKLADFRRDLGRTDGRASNTSFGTALDKYARTFGGLSPSSQKDKRAVIGKLKATCERSSQATFQHGCRATAEIRAQATTILFSQ